MAITKTSRAAYRCITSEQVTAVAEYMHSQTLRGVRVTDADISKALGIPKSTASARRNDLLSKGMFYAKDGFKWRPFMVSTTYDRATRKTVQSRALVIYNEDLTAPLFSSLNT